MPPVRALGLASAVGAGVLLLGGCYSPSAQPGLPCSANHSCPGGQICDEAQVPPICVLTVNPTDARSDGEVVACHDNTGCPTSAPVCDVATQVCRGCVADAECSSDVCHELAGTCVDEAATLYVSPAPTSGAGCSRQAPCSMDAASLALSPTRTTIKVAQGTYASCFDLKSPVSGGPTILVSGPDRDASRVVIAGSPHSCSTAPAMKAIVEGLTVQGATVRGFLARGPLTLSHVRVVGSMVNAVEARQGAVVLDSRLEASMTTGITCAGGPLELQRSVVVDNQGGGIVASAGFTIVNTVIANNGTAFNTSAPGATLTATGAQPAVFRFNTVANNTGTAPSGVACMQPTAIEDTIVASSLPLFADLGPMCMPAHSLFSSNAPAGNLMGDPLFVSPMTRDYHLKAGSPAIDAADPAATEPLDLDGEARPRGAARDIGADER